MLYSNKKKFLQVVFAILTGLLPFNAKSENANISIEQKTSVEPVAYNVEQKEAFACIIKEILQGIDIIYENKALDIKNGAIEVTDKDTFIDHILERRKIIEKVRNEISLINPDLSALAFASSLANALIQDLDVAIKNGFKELVSLDTDSLQTRSIETTPIEKFEKEITKNKQLFESVEKNAAKAGLTKRNISARWFDDKVIKPFYKYEVGRRLANSLILGTLAFEVLYVTDCFKNVDSIGRSPIIRAGECIPGWEVQVSARPFNPNLSAEALYQTHKFFALVALGYRPILKWFSDNTKERWKKDYFACKEFCSKKISAWWNNQKGGQYRREADRINNNHKKVVLDDLVGQEEIKEHFKLILEYIKDPDAADRAGLRPQLGYLLTGPTRTGKSYSVQALDGEIKDLCKEMDKKEFTFINVPQSFIRSYGINYMFSQARRLAPCILYIDELDLIGLKRDLAAQGKGENLADFLTQMSGTIEGYSEPVFIIATTNDRDSIDEALQQRGRFGCIVPFTYPSAEERKAYLAKQLKEFAVDIETFKLDRIAQQTENCSFEDLNALVVSALQHARMQGKRLSQEFLDDALMREIWHISKTDNFAMQSPKEQALVATHQAGCAIGHLLCNTGSKLSAVTTYPVKMRTKADTQSGKDIVKQSNNIVHGKVFTCNTHDRIDLYTKEELIGQCKAMVAGFAAEKVLINSCGYTYQQENKKLAYDIAKAIKFKGLQGINPNQLPEERRNELLTAAMDLVDTCEQEMCNIFTKHKDALLTVASVLAEDKFLTGSQVRMIFEHFAEPATA